MHGIPPTTCTSTRWARWTRSPTWSACAPALRDLGLDRLTAAPVALGSGGVARGAHGVVPVPAPAVARNCPAAGGSAAAGAGRDVHADRRWRWSPTLSTRWATLPPLRVGGSASAPAAATRPGCRTCVRSWCRRDRAPSGARAAVVLEANVDDLDPRLWPGVLDRLLAAGAADAWLTPILMKKGRPAHTLPVLCRPGRRPRCAR